MAGEVRFADQRPAYRTYAWRQARRAALLLARPTARRRALPDYLIVGAQRAGTTSLHNYLLQSPSVASPTLSKGVHWFDVAYEKDIGWYRSHFPLMSSLERAAEESGRRSLTGEASPYYLFHPAVPQRIAQHLPDVKILIILRDPVQRAWSHYHHEVARGFESLSFAAALEAEPERLAGEEARLLRDPVARSYAHQHHGYLARGRYAEQIARYLTLFDRERLMIIDSADLKRSPEVICHQVAGFLEIDPWPLTDATEHNARRYDAMPKTLGVALRQRFADPDRDLATLLGRRFSWMEQV